MQPLRLGEIEIRKIVEIERMAVDPKWLFGNIEPHHVAENRDWLGPTFVEPGSDRLILSFHSYLIRTPRLNILVDTCNGNDKQRPSVPAWHMLDLPYLERLQAAGVSADEIDIVLCTHLHTDHVGWNTRLESGRWVPTFPNARYVMSRAEFDYFDALHRSGPPQPVNRGSFADSVLPVVESGRALMVDPGDIVDAEIADAVSLEDAAGHSPGGVNILLRSGGRLACLCGDAVHHPLQCTHPELGSPADYDPAMAVATRRRMFDRYADTDTLLLTGHFPDPTAGRIIGHGDGFRFRFAE